jgi:hypothetical protein
MLIHLCNRYPEKSHRRISVGYTQIQVPEDNHLGIFKGSWGYHADDGGLYIDALEQDSLWSCSNEAERYKAGDTVVCGLTMITGEGYRRLNGEYRDSCE